MKCPMCSKEFKNVQGFKGHVPYCKGQEDQGSSVYTTPSSDCECSDGGTWEVLNAQQKQIAKQQYPNENYREVCVKCLELR
jgi:hypothetical protein